METNNQIQSYKTIIAKTETGATLNTVMSNSFGFGGTNAALIFEKV